MISLPVEQLPAKIEHYEKLIKEVPIEVQLICMYKILLYKYSLKVRNTQTALCGEEYISATIPKPYHSAVKELAAYAAVCDDMLFPCSEDAKNYYPKDVDGLCDVAALLGVQLNFKNTLYNLPTAPDSNGLSIDLK